jgi:hypothetical protein
MTRAACGRYDRAVAAVRDALRRAAASLALILGLLHPVAANAASSSFAIGDGGVVQVIAGARSEITVKAWDRPNVQLDTDDESVGVVRRPLAFGTPKNPLSVSIPLANVVTRDPLNGTSGPATLPPEEFPYASDFRAGVHDSLRIETAAGTHTTVMIPPSVAILQTRIRGTGVLSIDGYHGGTLFVGMLSGRAQIANVMTSAFMQVMNGRLEAIDSSFDRLRARSNNADLIFDHDRARQIEVTTISGAIVYDNGTFDPGLARFESTNGSIAIGVAGPAQIEARSNTGHVYSMWDRRTPIEQRDDGDASATVGGGGPVVNAISGHGNVYLYDGALATRQTTPLEWRPVRQALFGPTGQLNAPNAFERFRRLRGGRL